MMPSILRRATALIALAAMLVVQGCNGYRRPPASGSEPDDHVVLQGRGESRAATVTGLVLFGVAVLLVILRELADEPIEVLNLPGRAP